MSRLTTTAALVGGAIGYYLGSRPPEEVRAHVGAKVAQARQHFSGVSDPERTEATRPVRMG